MRSSGEHTKAYVAIGVAMVSISFASIFIKWSESAPFVIASYRLGITCLILLPFLTAQIPSLGNKFLQDVDLPLVPDWAESRFDEWLARKLATDRRARHFFSFVERGGWYSADPFVAWLECRLDQPRPDDH